ncbi:hypothetical protein ABTN69_19675, partial [Acinetobacter baumannii]
AMAITLNRLIAKRMELSSSNRMEGIEREAGRIIDKVNLKNKGWPLIAEPPSLSTTPDFYCALVYCLRQ